MTGTSTSPGNPSGTTDRARQSLVQQELELGARQTNSAKLLDLVDQSKCGFMHVGARVRAVYVCMCVCWPKRVAFYFWQHFMQKLNALRDFALILACSKEGEGKKGETE